MLYIRISPNRILFVSEYWILFPLIISIEIAIIARIRKSRVQQDLESEKLKKDFVRWKIFNIATKNIFSNIFIRGGHETMIIDDFVHVSHENCLVPQGVQFLDNEWLRKLLLARYSDKVKNGILYITRTALCHFASEAGLGILDNKVIQISDVLLGGKKTFAAILTSLPIPLLGIWGRTTIPVVLSLVTFLSGAGSMFLLRESSFLLIQTQVIAGPISHIAQRIQDRKDVVVIDLQPSNDKVSMRKSSVPYECSLPDQMIGNQICIREAEIDIKSADVVVDMLIDYDEVVNMEDVTGLSGEIKFSDQFETLPIENPGPKKSQHSRINPNKSRKRTTNLLEKFGDPDHIPDSETWDISRNTEHNNRNK